MPAKRLIRTLILVQILFLVGIGVAAYFSGSLLPEGLRELMNSRDAGPGAGAFELGGTVAFLVATICVFVFWSGAPMLYLIVTVLLQLASFALGPFVSTGFIDLFETASNMLNGVILGLIYFSPARELFKRQPAAAAQPNFAPPPPPPMGTPAPATQFCGACGARGQGGRFCPECGTPLVANLGGMHR